MRLPLVSVLVAGLFAGLVTMSPSGSAERTLPGLTAAGGTGWIPDVPVAADAFSSESNPSVTTAANGNLYMVYQANPAGNYDLYFAQSIDGLSWSVPVAVVNTLTDEITPSVAQDPFSGRTFVAYAYGGSGATPIQVAYSDDLLTWTTRTVLNCGVQCERPRIASEYWNGANNIQYVALAGPIGGADWNVAVARSLDDGDSWTFYESGFGATDVRYQPDITVQRGSDGVDRVYVFYRGGAAFPPTDGYVEWSETNGASWAPRAQWYSNVYSPPTVAAAHDGRSLLLAYSTNTPQVTWVQVPYPQALTIFNGTWDFLPTGGTDPAVSADGRGTTDTTIGGVYNLVAHDTSGALFHVQAPVTLTSNADWSSSVTFTDVGAVPSTTFPTLSVTSQDRGLWYPAVAWTDERDTNADVYFTTYGPGGGLIDVTLATNPPGLRVTFDNTTRVAPATFWVTGGFHTINVSSSQGGAPGWRYAFADWSDGGAISHVINVTGSTMYTANFTTQVLLTANSAPGGVTGAGWYDLDTSATVTATTPQAGPTGWQYRFTDWTGDITNASASTTVLMDAPKTITANWATQVLLTIASAYGGVSGAGWYDLSASATFVAEASVAGGDGTRYIFAAWTGDAVDPSLIHTLLMDEPKFVTANWQTEYFLAITTNHGTVSGGGWYPQNGVATVTLGAREVTEGGKVWQFTGWSGGASGATSVANVTMAGPVNLTANWREKATFPLGYLWIPLLIALAIAALLLVVFLMKRKRQRAAPPPPGAPPAWFGDGPQPPMAPPPAP